MPEYYQITNLKGYKKFLTRMKKQHGVKTVHLRTSLKTVSNYVSSIPNTITNNFVIKKCITNLFSDTNIVYSNDPGINTSAIGKLNTLFILKTDLLEGKKFYSPLSLTHLPDNTRILHPGNSRLMIADLYPWPVDIVCSYYSKRFHIPQGFEKINIEDFSVDIFDSTYYMLYGFTNDLNMNKSYRIPELQPPVMTKQIVDHKEDRDRHSFHHPELIDPPRRYEFDGESICVDGYVVCRLIDSVWQVNFDLEPATVSN